ncbi:MFS transporter [Garicola koreensis]|uniref:MFS family permease n=2 Tax=Garicola koreensis TaxID=1262554 RepID=A0A7W5XKV5_9MICC|nr:MFS transporter [Garicola koreensis]MBB3668057.1 MFS family permease [Garicola koreensis]
MSRSSSDSASYFGRLVYSLAVSIGVSFGAILFGTSVLITSTAAGAVYSLSLLSAAFSGSVLTGAALAIPVGRYADRHGIRGLTALGGVLVMLGFCGFGLSTTPWQLLGSWWLLVGPGSAMVLFDPGFIALQQWFTRQARNRAAGTLTLITGLAGPIFIPSTTFLVEGYGWRVTAAVLGLLVLATTTLASAWALRVAPAPATIAPALETEEIAVADGRGLPAGFLPLTIAVVCTMAVLESFNVHRIARFESSGFDPTMLAWWAAAVGLLSLPARFLLPVLANRFNSATLWLVVTVLIMPSVWMAIRGTHTWELYGHFILFGLLFGAFMPLRAVVMSDWYSGPRFGTLMGIQAVALAGGRAAGPAVTGWLADSPVGYPAAMLLLSLLLIIGAIMTAAALRRQLAG